MVQMSSEINNVVEFPLSTSPQEIKPVKADLDKGYTRIANELLEQAYTFPFTLVQLKAFLYIARTTYGWRQKARCIPHCEFSIEGIIRTDKVGALLRSMVEARVLNAEVGRHSTHISINTMISQWSKPTSKPKNKTPKQGAETPKQGAETPKQGAQTPKLTEHIIKEDNIKKENNNYCPVSTEPPPEIDLIESQAKELIDHLNKAADSNFRHSKSSLKHLKARLNEGISFSDLKLIIDYKVWEWKDDPKMKPYLRPKTLFNEDNAESYINAANQIKQSGVNHNANSHPNYSQHSNQGLSTVERHSQRCNEYERKLSAEIERLERLGEGEAPGCDGEIVETIG